MPETIDWNHRYATKDAPWDSGRPSCELQRVVDERQIKPCRTIELGCGSGTNAVFLAQHGFDVTAFDLSPLALEPAKQKAKGAGAQVRLFVADILDPPDFGDPIELVFDRGVYHSLRPRGLF